MHILDDEKKILILDPSRMLQNIKDLPDQIETCWQQIKDFSIPTHYIKAKNVLILGMGGSAIAGDLTNSLSLLKCRIPVVIHRDYDLPEFTNPETLVIGVSYSGNTEETISGFERAAAIGAKIIGISTGGTIASICRKYKAPMFSINYGSQPRASLGYQLIAMIGIFNKLGFLQISESEILEAVTTMKTFESKIHIGIPTYQNQVKQLADRLKDKIPIIFGSGYLQQVARRWKTQINENSKHLAFFEILPELNHNMINSFDFPKKLSEKIFVIMLQSKFDHPRAKVRQQITLQILQQKKIQYETIFLNSANAVLSEMFLSIFFGDYLSYYLALLNNVDPSVIPAAEYLKDRLNSSK